MMKINEIRKILLGNLRPVRFFSMLLSIAGMTGMFLHPHLSFKHDDLTMLLQIFPDMIWGYLFLMHTTGRFIDIVELAKCPKMLAYSNTVLGVWLWSMLFASSLVVDPLESLSILYVVAIFVEVWILVREINERSGTVHVK